MIYKLLHFLSAFLLFFQFSLSAQNTPCIYSIKGIVIDGETNESFTGVSIYVKELERGAISDEKGKFQIANVCRGNYTVVYSILGYKTFVTQYSIEENIFDKVLLHTDTCHLESVTVFGKKQEEFASMAKSTLSTNDLDRARGLSLGETLKELPGITTFKSGNSVSKPVIHGLHSNRIVILNAGLRQEGQQWGNEHAPEIDPFVSDKMVVIKGAAGVQYGSDAIAGVVIVEPRQLPKYKGVAGEISFSGMSNNRQGATSALLEGKLGVKLPLTWRIQGSFKKAGNTKTPSYYQANTGFEERNFSYALGYDKKWFNSEFFYSQFNTDLGIFSGADVNTIDDLKNAINRTEPAIKSDFTYEIKRPFQHVEHELARLKFGIKLTRIGKINFQFGRQFNNRSEFDVLRNSIANAKKEVPQLQFKLTTHSADVGFEHRFIRNFTGSIGASFMRQSNIWQGRFLIPSFVSHSYGLFILEKWTKNRVEAEAGFRFDIKELDAYINQGGVIQKNVRNFSSPSSILGIAFKLNEKILLKSNIGFAWRAPTVNELYSKGYHQGTKSLENGDPQLVPEKSIKLISAFEYQSQKLASEISLYYNQINDFIYLQPDKQETDSGMVPLIVQTTRGPLTSYTYKQVNASFVGVDIINNYSFNKSMTLIPKGAIVLAKDISNNSYLINIPPIRYSATLRYAIQNEVIKNKYEPFFSISASRVEKQTRINPNEDYALPPNSYTLIDAEFGFGFKMGKQQLKLNVQVNNIFDVSYRDYMNRFRYYTDEMGRNIAVRLKLPFGIYSPKAEK